MTEVALQFHAVPHLAFEGELARELRPNTLVLRIQPDEGISLQLRGEGPRRGVPGADGGNGLRVQQGLPRAGEADGYERLLHDAMIGDATLFIRTDEVEQAWRIVDPYLEAWADPTAACTSTRPAPGAPTSPTCCSSARVTPGGAHVVSAGGAVVDLVDRRAGGLCPVDGGAIRGPARTRAS